MRTTWTILIAIITLLYLPAYANDSIARVGAGGIVLLKTNEIRMVQENLKISKNEIEVRYRFQNERNEDIITTVAFPMPSYGWVFRDDQGRANEKPLESFSVASNGRKIDISKSRAAMVGDHDVTDKLRNIGLTDEQIFDRLDDMEPETDFGFSKSQLENMEAIGAFENYPLWKVHETAHWQQCFPAQKEIEVVHTYQPFVGRRYNVASKPGKTGKTEKRTVKRKMNGGIIYEPPTASDDDEACLDEQTRQAIDHRITFLFEKSALEVTVWLDHVEYILGTGRNWKGPIGEFTLTIEKESPDQIISLCFPGKPKVVNPTTLEFKQVNYVPQDKLVVYFYSVKADY